MGWAVGKLYFNILKTPCLDIPQLLEKKSGEFPATGDKYQDGREDVLASLRPARRF